MASSQAKGPKGPVSDAPPTLWLKCRQCNLAVQSQTELVQMRPHLGTNGDQCESTSFEILGTERSALAIERASLEAARRKKKAELSNVRPKAARKGQKGTSRWDGVRATTARPSRGSAGAPTLGKR